MCGGRPGITGALIADELAGHGHDVVVVDPYRLASRLLRRMQRQGTRVFDRTQVKSITATRRSVQLTTTSGLSMRAKYAVIANGYEAQCCLRRRVAKNRSSYAYMSDPVDPAELGWLASTLLWESSRPYLYLRSTGDGRLLVGEDDDHYSDRSFD